MFPVAPWLIIIVAVAIAGFLALTIVTIVYGIRAHRQQISVGKEELIGKTAEAVTVIAPKGIVLVEGERWAAILDKGQAEPGEEVIITKVKGLKLHVVKK